MTSRAKFLCTPLNPARQIHPHLPLRPDYETLVASSHNPVSPKGTGGTADTIYCGKLKCQFYME
jgi:hypothetical protein